MTKKFLVAVAITAIYSISLPTFANDAAIVSAQKVQRLVDGGTLYIFKDGKMGLEDRLGRAAHLKLGHVYESIEGQKITATSNEIARIDSLLKDNHVNGG